MGKLFFYALMFELTSFLSILAVVWTTGHLENIRFLFELFAFHGMLFSLPRMALPLFFEFVFAQRLPGDAVTVLIF
ncbi:hypothetical protein Enr17x_60250 [Gimesia fumaroli]|uniref:Uncharacterized protein n=1 Tax=Gimesia fumaroli TaxID=2527976 RepID=A0A518ILH9_9PLAN|nr:hypothetical protein Enr17x_60250 [Gimesia fumaroli]